MKYAVGYLIGERNGTRFNFAVFVRDLFAVLVGDIYFNLAVLIENSVALFVGNNLVCGVLGVYSRLLFSACGKNRRYYD